MPLDDWKGPGFPAYDIEHDCARLFGIPVGQRGTVYDADVFRVGEHHDLGKFLNAVADRIETRAGTADAAVQDAIQRLRRLAADLRKSHQKEPDDYHWLITSSLLKIVAALLEQWGK